MTNKKEVYYQCPRWFCGSVLTEELAREHRRGSVVECPECRANMVRRVEK